MKLRRMIATAIVCGVVSFHASAQVLGNQTSRTDTTMTSSEPSLAFTLIDFSHPATSAGQLTTAWFRWTNNCTGAAKIKVLRRNAQALGTFTITERGPFDATMGTNVVTLSPAIAIQPGDYIGITELRGSGRGGCGATPLAESTDDQILLVADGDLQSGSFANLRQMHGYEMNVIASATTSVLSAVVPGAGAAAGQNGAFFRTSIQLTNVLGSELTARVVFHPAGQPASASDPAAFVTLAGYETRSSPDIVTVLGRAGLGSIDVYTGSGIAPIVTARIYNDLGANGTAGFTEEGFRPSQALQPGEQGVLQVPADLAKFRFNVGIRTLDAGANVTITVYNAELNTLETTTRSYPANYFIQTSGVDFAGHPLSANSHLIVDLTSGSAFVFGTTTDNKTNDSSVQFAARR